MELRFFFAFGLHGAIISFLGVIKIVRDVDEIGNSKMKRGGAEANLCFWQGKVKHAAMAAGRAFYPNSGASFFTVARARAPFAADRTLYPCSVKIPANKRRFSGVSSTTRMDCFFALSILASIR